MSVEVVDSKKSLDFKHKTAYYYYLSLSNNLIYF